jgi:hypothetical protein
MLIILYLFELSLVISLVIVIFSSHDYDLELYVSLL